MKNLINAKDLSKEEILTILDQAKKYLDVTEKRYCLDIAKGKILATLFFEPSTRTRFSFETAMLRLGGSVISNADMGTTSSAKKGESLADTGKTVSQMADIIAMRHPVQGSVYELSNACDVPVVNAGDGAGDHPTQALLDIFTIQNEFGRLNDLTIAMVGDLKHSRVVHSQCELLKHFKNIKFILVSPNELKMPAYYKNLLTEYGFEYEETTDLKYAIANCDVLSDTRIQEERFASKEEFEKHNGIYIMNEELMRLAKPDMILIDPLPRVNHIDPAIDNDPRAKYFVQIKNGVAVRMAILSLLLKLS